MTVGSYSIYKSTRDALKAGGIESPALEAACIVRSVYGADKMELLVNKPVDDSEEKREMLSEILNRRIAGEPLQYLVGEWEFYGFPFLVGEGVLIPRSDTEALVEAALERISGNASVCDLCSGSGCVAVALKKLRPEADVAAAELYDDAFEYLKRNIELNKAEIKALKADVTDASHCSALGGFDVVTANPPYLTKQDMESLQREVSFEPRTALFGGDDGLEMYRKITKLWSEKIKPGGWLIYEIGAGQHDAVAEILKENGFDSIEFKEDINKIIRVVLGKRR